MGSDVFLKQGFRNRLHTPNAGSNFLMLRTGLANALFYMSSMPWKLEMQIERFSKVVVAIICRKVDVSFACQTSQMRRVMYSSGDTLNHIELPQYTNDT